MKLPSIGFNLCVSVLALAAACAYGFLESQHVEAGPVSTLGGPVITEFVIGQNMNVETVTCVHFYAHYDLQQYGTVEGDTCTATAPLLVQDGNTGHVNVNFSMTNGVNYSLAGCHVDSTVMMPGFYRVTVNCVNF